MQAATTQPVPAATAVPAMPPAAGDGSLRLDTLVGPNGPALWSEPRLDPQTLTGEFTVAPSASDPLTGETAGHLSLDTVLSPYVVVFCTAFLIAYAFTPIMRVVAVAYGIVDQPDKVRKLHERPVAYLGGVAVFLGFIAALAVSMFFTQNHNPFLEPEQRLIKIPAAFLASTFVVAALGFIDDIRGVRPKLKILGQLAAAATLFFSGIGDEIAKQPRRRAGRVDAPGPWAFRSPRCSKAPSATPSAPPSSPPSSSSAATPATSWTAWTACAAASPPSSPLA